MKWSTPSTQARLHIVLVSVGCRSVTSGSPVAAEPVEVDPVARLTVEDHSDLVDRLTADIGHQQLESRTGSGNDGDQVAQDLPVLVVSAVVVDHQAGGDIGGVGRVGDDGRRHGLTRVECR